MPNAVSSLRVGTDGQVVRRRFRGAASKQASPHGTALGLSIVAEVWQRCGRERQCEPNDPTGLSAVVTGPVVAPPAKRTQSAAA